MVLVKMQLRLMKVSKPPIYTILLSLPPITLVLDSPQLLPLKCATSSTIGVMTFGNAVRMMIITARPQSGAMPLMVKRTLLTHKELLN